MNLQLPLLQVDGKPSEEQRNAYRDSLVDHLVAQEYHLKIGPLELFLCRSYGFCWGVDRAIFLVNEVREKNPEKKLWLIDQIIHNPKVNADMDEMGIGFLNQPDDNLYDQAAADDIVFIPAFSAEIEDLQKISKTEMQVVDTTCPWVEKPHRRTLRNIKEGFTTLIHGKAGHQETRATCSLILHEGGHYLIVSEPREAELVCRFIRGEINGADLLSNFENRHSRGFDTDLHLSKVSLINQTTMLASESRHIANMLRQAVLERFGEDGIKERFRDFDTICNATQKNQDALRNMLDDKQLDLVLVVGGFNSSNTDELHRLASQTTRSFHIESAANLESESICQKTYLGEPRWQQGRWLPALPARIGFTSGASTPDRVLGDVIRRVIEIYGYHDARPELQNVFSKARH